MILFYFFGKWPTVELAGSENLPSETRYCVTCVAVKPVFRGWGECDL